MKNILITILLLSLGHSLSAQKCISGDCANGYGICIYANGDKYVGEFKDAKRNGQGTWTFANGNKYEGEWKDGLKNGHGTFTWSDGKKYIGSWSDNSNNGQGTMYLTNGILQSGIWEYGTLKYPDSKQNTARSQSSTSSSSGKVIQMTKQSGGLYEIPVSINGALNTYFILDSGASEVSIAPDVVLTLIRSKVVSEGDFLEGRYYTFADGSTAKSERINLKKLVIGDFTLYNVTASISNSISAPMLLGQNVLSRLGKIQIDYTNHTLTVIK